MIRTMYYEDEIMIPLESKVQKLTAVSRATSPVTMDDVRSHMAMLFPINKPPMALPKLSSQPMSLAILVTGRLYIILKGGNRYTVMYTSKGLRQIEGPRAKDGTTTYYKGFAEWCTKVGASFDDVLVAGKPAHHD